jgi:hypothetical protein
MKRTTDSFIGWCAKRDRSDPTPCDCSRTSSLAVSRFRIGAATGGRSCRWEPSRHVIGPIGRDEPCEYRSLRISAGQFGYDGQIGTNARWHSVVVSRYPRPTSCTVSRRPKTTNSGPTGKVGMYPRLGVLGGDSQSRGVAYARNEGVVGGEGPRPVRPPRLSRRLWLRAIQPPEHSAQCHQPQNAIHGRGNPSTVRKNSSGGDSPHGTASPAGRAV